MGDATIIFKTDKLSIEIKGDELEVKAAAAKFQGGLTTDTLGMILSQVKSNPAVLTEITKKVDEHKGMDLDTILAAVLGNKAAPILGAIKLIETIKNAIRKPKAQVDAVDSPPDPLPGPPPDLALPILSGGWSWIRSKSGARRVHIPSLLKSPMNIQIKPGQRKRDITWKTTFDFKKKEHGYFAIGLRDGTPVPGAVHHAGHGRATHMDEHPEVNEVAIAITDYENSGGENVYGHSEKVKVR